MEWEYKQQTETDRICNVLRRQTGDKLGQNLQCIKKTNRRQTKTEFEIY
jgi:hypothetical protein